MEYRLRDLRVSRQQYAFILEYMEKHGDLSRPLPGLKGKVTLEHLWTKLVVKLNSIGTATKPVRRWKRFWSDWKTKVKKKAMDGRLLSGLEERMLKILEQPVVKYRTQLTREDEEDFVDPLVDENGERSMLYLQDHYYTKSMSPEPATRQSVASTSMNRSTAKEHTESDDDVLDHDSELWGFFDKEPHKKAKCSMCGERLTQDSDVLYSHLKEKHSNISENLEIRENEDTYTEIIYLENPDSPTEKKPRIDIQRRPLKRRKSQEEDKNYKPYKTEKKYKTEKCLKSRQNKENIPQDDEIENFGKYVTSLLRDVPSNLSKMLQKDIINLIMNAKLEEPPDIEINKEKPDPPIHEGVENDSFKDSTRDRLEDQIDNHDQTQDQAHETTLNKSGHRQKHRFSYSQEIPKTLTEKEETQIEYFGKYVTGLLRDIPYKNIGAKIQMDIVNLIMTARIKMTDNAKILTVDGTIEIENTDNQL